MSGAFLTGGDARPWSLDISDRPKGATRTGQAALATLRRARILEPVQAIENRRDVGFAESGLQPSIGVPKRTARTITCSIGAKSL